ncbi:MAG: helix-turn-helix domain-containing protein [Lachnospiraceae bacterium]|nr:helix-turn-helix domain-containing protein [Lachnospiraceae bacterium]
MNIEILEGYLDKITISKQIFWPEFDYSNGISFLFAGMPRNSDATLFVGTLSVWRNVVRHNKIIEKATYLICNDEPENDSDIFKNLNANLFLLNTSTDVLLHRLDQGITLGFAEHQAPLRQTCRDFMNDLKNGYLSSYDTALARFTSLYHPVKSNIGVIIVQSETDVQSLGFRDRVELALTSFFPETNFFYYEKEWVIFYTQDKETTEKLDFSYEDFSAMLKSNALYASIGYPCQRPDLLYNIYKTTSLALSVCLRMGTKPAIPRVYTYKEINLLLLVHLGSQRFKQRLGTNNTMYLAHPDAVKIYYHDLESNDNLLEILTVYLSTAQSITESAKRLFMHRNTVHNKINRIKELTSLDFSDGYSCCLLLLSCMILQYQKMCGKMDITDFL